MVTRSRALVFDAGEGQLDGTLIGTILDKYEILQKVGEGGMATVYRGRHTTLGRDVAIKILHPHLSASERNRQRFAREARAIEHLDHDNILKIFDYSGTRHEDCYIVTEFVDGVTLQQILSEQGSVPSEVAAMLGIELAQALGYAHDLGIIHRDLKLENVMVRRDGTVKLMDFGIARFLDEIHLTVTGALVGSPAYMSPEQAMEKVLDLRSDLFSLGTLLFYLVTGQLPFSGSNPSVILRNIIEGNRPEVVEMCPDVSGGLAEVIERLLQVEPDDRFSTSSEVEQALRANLSEVSLSKEDRNWTLHSWLTDPTQYRERLDEHLAVVLLKEGRKRIEEHDHLGALRLFNRLLSIDEDNAEVLELVSQMHARRRDGRSRAWWGAGLALMATAALITYLLWPAAKTNPLIGVGDTITSGSELGSSGLSKAPSLPLTDANRTPENPSGTTSESDRPGTTKPNASGDPGQVSLSAPLSNASRVTENRPDEDPEAEARRLERRERRKERAAQQDGGASEPEIFTSPADPDLPGLVTVLVRDSWGNIYIDNTYMGRTGEVSAIPVTPGTHALRVENDLALPHTQKFSVAPGERVVLEIDALQRKPATIQLDSSIAGDCVATVDGRIRGQVSSLGHRLQLKEPDRAHTLDIACQDGTKKRIQLGAALPGAVIQVSLD